MDKLKILIVSRSFYPESSPRSFRTTELVKEFSRRGHEVTLLTNERDFDYSDFLEKYPIKIDSFGKLNWKPLKGPKMLGDLPRKLGRLMFLLMEYPNVEILFRIKETLPKYKGYDLMISVAVPHPVHWGVALVQNRNSKTARTWIADCGDPFMGNTLESIRPPLYFSYLEKLFCRKADYISVPTEGSKNGYYPEFHNKIVVIPQGFDFNEFQIDRAEVVNAVPTFAYAGGLGATGIRNPRPFVQHLLNSGIDFRFHVYSGNSSMLRDFQIAAPDKVILHEPVQRQELLRELAKMDFVINFDNGSVNQTPSKLIDYALVGRPILNFSAEEPDTRMIGAFLASDYSLAMNIPDISNYEIGNVASKFIQFVK